MNLVLVRPALLYGPYTVTGGESITLPDESHLTTLNSIVTPRVLIGEVYKHLGEKLEFLSVPLSLVLPYL